VKEFDDCLTAQILDQSVIVLRGTDGALHGFYNVCRRRGHQLLSVSGHVKSVVCPYRPGAIDSTANCAPHVVLKPHTASTPVSFI
jgi:carnitine monooxygenase subunit